MARLTTISTSASITFQDDKKTIVSDLMEGAGGEGGSPVPPCAGRTLNRPPMTERIMIAKTDTTTLYEESMVSLMLISRAGCRGDAPAPGIEGGNDRLHVVAG